MPIIFGNCNRESADDHENHLRNNKLPQSRNKVAHIILVSITIDININVIFTQDQEAHVTVPCHAHIHGHGHSTFLLMSILYLELN